MKCPFCGFADSKVIDSRPSEERTRRRRECTKCQNRFTSYEAVEVPLLTVKKRDKSFEPFDRNKLINGVYSAIKKRPVSIAKVEAIADYIEFDFANKMKSTISSKEIGDITLEKLRDIDVVAYIRFASVYKDFTDIESFIALISELEK